MPHQAAQLAPISSGSLRLIPASSCHTALSAQPCILLPTAPRLKEMPSACHRQPLLSLPLSFSRITEHPGRISFLRALPFPVNHCLMFLLAKQSVQCPWSRWSRWLWIMGSVHSALQSAALPPAETQLSLSLVSSPPTRCQCLRPACSNPGGMKA